MIKNFINEYPYTNLTYANIDWLIKKVKELSGDTEDTDAGIQAFLGAYANEYPYSSLTYANIDWLIKNVGGLDAEVTKLSAQMETLQADVDNVVTKFGDKVDKLETKNVVYATDNSTPAKTIGIQYMESPLEGTIPIRDGIGSLQVPNAQDATQAVNKGQMDTALDGKVDKTNSKQAVYIINSNGVNTTLPYSYGSTPNTIPVRGEKAALKVGYPIDNYDAANKKYVDNAIATAPTGGWTTVIDKTWTEDETTTTAGYKISIPTEYQKPITELRLRYYMNTPQAGAVYAGDMQTVVLDTANNSCSIAYVAQNKLIDQDTKEFNVDWTSTGYNDVDNLRAFKDARGVYDKGIPTSNAMAPLNQSTITYANSQKNLDALLENRTHTVIDGTTTKTYTGTLVTDLHIEPPATTNVTAIDFGIIEQPLTVDNITNRLTFKKGDITYTVSAVAENRYDATYTTLSGTLSPAGYFVYYVSGDSSGRWQKGRLYYTQNNDVTISMDNALVVTDISATYTTNDYYSSDNADVILSQVIGSTNGKHIGELVDFNKSITACTFKWAGETAISYKQVWTVHADIIDENIQSTYSGLTLKNKLTSFDSRIGVENLNGSSAVVYYCGTFKDGTPTAIKLIVPTSTSNGVTANKIYAGSRLVVQARY